MRTAVVMGIGASLFVFGILWLFSSSSLAFVVNTSRLNPQYLAQLQFVIQFAGVLSATIGAGLFAYGHAKKGSTST